MLVLRQEQIDAFNQAAYERFVALMMRNLRNHFAARTADLDDPALQSIVEGSIIMLSELGVKRECDVERYLYLDFACGLRLRDSHSDPKAQAILCDQAMPGDLRIELLYRSFGQFPRA